MTLETRYVAWSRDAKIALLERGGEAAREIIAKEHSVEVKDVEVWVSVNGENVNARVTKPAKDWPARCAAEAAYRSFGQ